MTPSPGTPGDHVGATDPGGEPAGDPGRAERLAALLSVDVAVPATGAVRAHPDADDAPPVTASLADRNTTSGLAWGILVVLLFSGVGLGYAGVRIVRDSTEGRVLAPIDDPAAPGFEAVVDATPTLVMMHDTDGLLDSLVVLTLPDPERGGGGVILVPERTIADLALFDTNPIELAYDLGDPSFEANSTGLLLGAAMHETAVVDSDRWAALVGPVAPISVDNPNEIPDEDGVRFAAGEIDLAAADVGPYLEARIEGESDLARLFRHEIFWNAWLDAVAADGTDSAVPGELDSGLGRFVRTISRGAREVQTLPVEAAPTGRYGEEPAFLPDIDQVTALVDRLIPLPVSPGPGLRARLRVLNGTNDTTQAPMAARQLPPAGVEVTIVGNAGSFDSTTTTVEYSGSEFLDEAERVAEILGVGEVVEETRPSDSVDITVTLGTDYG